MIYLLDSSAISDLMREDPSTSARAASVGEPDRIVTCTIVRGEVLFGLKRTQQGRRARELRSRADSVFSYISCEALSPDVGDQYADLRLSQQKLGLSLDDNDLWIAVTTLSLGATLVTRDTDFDGIERLRVENWSRST